MASKGKRRAEEEPETDENRAGKMPNAGRTPPTTRRMSNSASDFSLTEATFKQHMEGLDKRLDKIEGMSADIKRNKDDIVEVRRMLTSTETNLLERIDDQKKQMELLVKATVASTSGASNPAGRLTPKQEEAYWLHRRSLSMWPLLGDDVGAALRTFLTQKLRFTEEQIRDMGRISFRRLKEPLSKARKEVFCTFETKEARDTVKGASKHLASEGAGVGLRAQFPGFLLDNFRLLENIGYNLRAGDETVRRAVKFDDAALDLMMDVKLGDEWKRIRPAEARVAVQNNPKIRRGPEEMTGEDLSSLVSTALSKTPATGANATRMA